MRKTDTRRTAELGSSDSVLTGRSIVPYGERPLITDENLINFNRSHEELQIYLLYCGFSVQRTRARAVEALAMMLDSGKGELPFDRIRSLIGSGRLRKELEKTRIGRFDQLEKFLRSVVEVPIDLEKCGLEDLLKISGIGLAKSRFFLLNTRPDAQVAVLDRHILSELRAMGYSVPSEAPQNEREYQRVERYFLAEAHRAGVHPARFNLASWRKRAQVPRS